MMLTERRISRRLFAAFAVIALAFVASGTYANWLSVRIDAESQALVANALPSLAHLGAALSALSRLQAGIEEYADLPAAEQPAARSRIEEQRARIEAELASYRALPTYPGEDALYQDEPSTLRRVDEAVEQVYADVAAGDSPRARVAAEKDVRPRANQAGSLLRQLMRLNAAEASGGVARIRATRQRVAAAAFVLNSITLVLTAAMALWLWRVFRSFARLQAEHAKLLERRAEELEAFGSRVAHELLSPLSSLTFCLASFKAAAAGDPKLQDAMRRSRDCVSSARGLIAGLFDFARSGGEPEPGGRADVAQVVQRVVEDVRASDPAGRVDIEVAPLPSCSVRSTSSVLATILGNLVRNAVKYTRDSALRRVAIRVVRQGSSARFEVQDTGPGVPAGFEHVIFEPYARGPSLSQAGLGLGLATVKRLCEAHGGDVGVRSVPSGGSIFAFTLPLHVEDGSRAGPREVDGPPRAAVS